MNTAWRNKKGRWLVLGIYIVTTTDDINKASIISYCPDIAKSMGFCPVAVNVCRTVSVA